MGEYSRLGTTYSSGVFISHTSRVRSAGELRAGDTMSRHQQRKRYLTQLLEALPQAFARKKLNVWIDSREVSAGDQFEHAVCLSLIRCSAAVVLVDQDALTSEYMQEEAKLLGWRKILEPELQIVPVLLGDVSALDFARSPLGLTGGLSRLSVLTPASRKQNRLVAQKTAMEMSDHIDLVPLAPKVARWVNDLAHFIGSAPAHALDEAARNLGIPADTLAAHFEKHALIAAALLNSDLRDAFLVMRTLAEYLPHDDRRAAVHRVVPLWVDLDDARMLMSVTDIPPEQRIVHLIAGRLLPAGHAVLRGGASQDNVQMAELSSVAGEDMAAELIARYDDKLRTAMNFEPEDGPQEIHEYMSMVNTIAFALIKCDQVPPPVVRKVLLVLMKRFPGVVFALVSNKAGGLTRTIRGRQIKLATDEQGDRRTWHLIKQVQRLARTSAGTDVG
jgi:hypothetical protein